MSHCMAHRVCPWWLGYLWPAHCGGSCRIPPAFWRRMSEKGVTVVEPGPGMGFFTVELARRVGSSGRVIAVDIQPRMLRGLERRVARAGLSKRVQTRLSQPDSMGIAELSSAADLVVAFAVVHEMPEAARFSGSCPMPEGGRPLAAGRAGRLLLAEPAGHITALQFDDELADAAKAGLAVIDRPRIPRSRAALLRKRSGVSGTLQG